ncbi:MAG: hypothetical protein J7M25_12320 [Deltaproteobacteria bacterium]|nr:hypothetical protein [Deltaproteobacteria bacterium]
MRYRNRAFVSVVVFGALFVARTPAASARCTARVKNKILHLNKSAMEDYDLLEFESAKQSLLDAQRIARVQGCDTDMVNAKTYTNLAVLYIQGLKDEDRGRLMFRRALRISKNIHLDRQVATPKLIRIFNGVRKEMGISGGGGSNSNGGSGTGTPPLARPRPVARPRAPEKPAKGFEHTPVEEAPRTVDLVMTCRVGDDLGANRVMLFYKTQGQVEYQVVPMEKKTRWTWKAIIPGSVVIGRSMYYYIEARKGEKPMAASGNAASPYIIALTAPPKHVEGGTTENPFGGSGTGKHHKRKHHKRASKGGPIGMYISFGGGIHTGYVGKWYGDLSSDKPRRAGFAMGTYDGHVEVGYFLKQNMLLSLAFSLGYASSDISNVPVLGWQALARFRYVAVGGSDRDSLFKLYFGAELGGGDVYHSLALQKGVDTFRSGPGMILGALVGFWLGTSKIAWYLEVDPKVALDFTADAPTVDGAVVQHAKQHTFTLGLATGLAIMF